MNDTLSVINHLLVDIYENIVTIEENALKEGRFNDISVKEMHTIEAIGMYSSKSMSEIAKELDITVGTLSVAVNNLVKKDYVERFRCENDRRVVRVRLTKKGRLLYRVHDKFHMDMVKSCIVGLDNNEEIILSNALYKLNIYLKEKYSLTRGGK